MAVYCVVDEGMRPLRYAELRLLLLALPRRVLACMRCDYEFLVGGCMLGRMPCHMHGVSQLYLLRRMGVYATRILRMSVH
jgi:hypothetical protein